MKQPTAQERTKRVLRVNTQSVTHAITPKSPFVRGLAEAPSNDLFSRPVYVPGDGERMRSKRPGADDHLAFKSKGNLT